MAAAGDVAAVVKLAKGAPPVGIVVGRLQDKGRGVEVVRLAVKDRR